MTEQDAMEWVGDRRRLQRESATGSIRAKLAIEQDAIAEMPFAVDALERVLNLHRRTPDNTCSKCYEDHGYDGAIPADYPCETVTAIEAARQAASTEDATEAEVEVPSLPTDSGVRFLAYCRTAGDDAEDQEEFITAGDFIVPIDNRAAVVRRTDFEQEWTVTALVAEPTVDRGTERRLQLLADLDALGGDGFLIHARHKEQIAWHFYELESTKSPEAGNE